MKYAKLLSSLITSVSIAMSPVAFASDPPPLSAVSAAASMSYFFVGGQYVGESGKQVMQGAMYVEVLRPKTVSQPYPLVLFHGAAQTGTNWLGTPDGRPGWAQYFLERGYVVYMVDQPARGRSAWHPELDGKLRNFSAPALEKLFTATRELGTWPQAKAHSQWPGSGRMGDPVFDAFYATQVEFLASNAETQKLVQEAGAALLDRIGPAILLTHSQAGAFGWLIADARPSLVKGIIAVEPLGPPFRDAVLGDAKARPWGPTDIKITYDPPVTSPDEIALMQQEKPDAAGLSPCWLQKQPARKLANLTKTPVLIVAAEASYHAVYDHCTAAYLKQAGVPAEFLRLEDVGVKGNGHMVMLEKNNLDVARVLLEWAAKSIK
ncbi:MAG: alpha/beta fold hydrolase [Hyphomicrobiales bacterium]|nr:MAG: alpha/beta fold hydrolase [Hyphomicrobiales bacterium]